MDSDSTSNAAIRASFKDNGKRKKTNRLAKLKQSKLDVRREQWLSQGCKADSNGSSESSLLFLVIEEENRSPGTPKSMLKGLDIEKSCKSNVNLESHMSSQFGSSEMSRHCSGAVGEAEEDADNCLDDWEAIADALAAKEKQRDPTIEPPVGPKTVTQVDLVSPSNNSGAQANCRAWRPDDASRPQCLPNLLKQHTLSSTCGAINWAWQSIMPRPTSCPICYEDLDLTDSSFLPCPCGFRLCLFCHKRILEADERCPGCRKLYEVKTGDVGFSGGTTLLRMGRSFSVSAKY